MRGFLLVLLVCFICGKAFSQQHSDTLKPNEKQMVKDSRIDTLQDIYQATFKLKGYRVQIHSGNKRQPANLTKSTFLRTHSKTKAHLSYEQPYYKVRVGDFKTKLEALKFKNLIIKEFPNSFIVRDWIAIEGFN